MSLGGSTLLVQIDRRTLLGLIQEWMPLQGRALVPPFSLRTQVESSVLGPSYPSLDVLIDQVDLSLTPGTDHGQLLLRMNVGILRLSGNEWVIRGGRVKIELEFVKSSLLLARKLSASFESLQVDGPPQGATFAQLASAEADHLLDAERNKDTELLPDPDADLNPDPNPNPLKIAAFFGGVHRISDAETFTTFIGAPPNATVPRLIQPGRSVVLGQSADSIKELLLRPALRAALLNPNDPNADLPPPWGNGKIPRDQDDVHVDITRLDITFADGHLNLSGKFDAHDDCWSVTGGSFSQKMFLDFTPGIGAGTSSLVPRMEPASPNISYDVDIDFLCRLIEFAIAAALGLARGFIYGVALIIVMEIIKGSVNPEVPGISAAAVPLAARLGNTHWMSLQIIPEGAVMQGDILITLPATDPITPAVYLTASGTPETINAGSGQVTVQAPTCAPQVFSYDETLQRDHKSVRARARRMIEPVRYTWSINGNPLQVRSDVLKYVGTVVAALPPPNGTTISGHTIELAYEIGLLTFLKNTDILALHPRAEDANYEIRVDVSATDAVGRTASNAINLKFIGDKLQMDPTYDDYMDQCLQKTADIADEKGLQSKRPKIGDPVEQFTDVIDRIAEHVRLGNTQSAQETAAAAARAHGVEAVSKALVVKLRI